MNDLISRQAAIDAIGEQPLVWTDDDFALGRVAQWEYDVEEIKKLPSAQSKTEISYIDCSIAMMKMWIDNVLTDGEYNRIMDKLNTHHEAERRQDG